MTLKSVSTSLFLMAALLADTTCDFALPTAKETANINLGHYYNNRNLTSEPSCSLNGLIDNPEAV